MLDLTKHLSGKHDQKTHGRLKAGDKEVVEVNTFEELSDANWDFFGRGSFITPDDRLFSIGKYEHAEVIDQFGDYQRSIFSVRDYLEKGAIRIRETKTTTYIEVSGDQGKTLDRIRSLVDSQKIPVYGKKKVIIEDMGNPGWVWIGSGEKLMFGSEFEKLQKASPLPKDYWKDEALKLIAAIKPKLQAIYLAASVLASGDIGINLSWDRANQYAIDWATKHMDILLTQLMKTTVEGVGPIIADWVSSPTKDMGQLHADLSKYFNRDRASRIAVTETTRAFSEAAQEQFTTNGVEYWRWNTNQDEMIIEGKRRGVCIVCAPLNGKVVKIGEPFGTNKKGEPIIKPPDAHVNDRCWVTPVLKLDKHMGPGDHTTLEKMS